MSLEGARDKIELWRRDYNEFRSHSTQTYLTPAKFARKSSSEAVKHRFFLIQAGLLFGGRLVFSLPNIAAGPFPWG